VTSGAIAAGREHLNYPDLPETTASKQLLAAVGQSRLIETWEQLFFLYKLHIGQMLLTRADLEDRERFFNARDMMTALLENGIVPVVNENDAVATVRMKVGDNDSLSALVAILAEADMLLLLTDQNGLYTADPRTDPKAVLLPVVERIDDAVRAMAGGSVSGLGTGGMWAKVHAADVATRAGIPVVIASGDNPAAIVQVLSGVSVGTLFQPSLTPLESRKRWLFGAPPAGELVVDQGAANALCRGKRSLLPAGITAVRGNFSRGEVVKILNPAGMDLAHGLARYNSDSLSRIMGRQSRDIESVLGYDYGPVAVHRDDLLMLGGNDA
jgi:glutamate 5-kinase